MSKGIVEQILESLEERLNDLDPDSKEHLYRKQFSVRADIYNRELEGIRTFMEALELIAVMALCDYIHERFEPKSLDGSTINLN